MLLTFRAARKAMLNGLAVPVRIHERSSHRRNRAKDYGTSLSRRRPRVKSRVHAKYWLELNRSRSHAFFTQTTVLIKQIEFVLFHRLFDYNCTLPETFAQEDSFLVCIPSQVSSFSAISVLWLTNKACLYIIQPYCLTW